MHTQTFILSFKGLLEQSHLKKILYSASHIKLIRSDSKDMYDVTKDF